MKHAFVCGCVAAALSLPVLALEAPLAQAPDARPPAEAKPAHDEPAARLNEVVVTAVPLGQGADQLVTPVSVLEGAALDDARGASLGQTIANLPGVSTSAYGQGVGRPVIRGLDGPRVAVLADGLGSADASAVSQDHAVTVEPFLADQIEILKGPATLLYGPGAIGGVVNVVDGRIPQAAPAQGLAGRAQLQYDGVSDGGAGMLRIDAGNDRFALHADGLKRDLGDYAIPGRTLPNSYVRGDSGALGGSLLGDWGYLGLSVSRFLDTYGNPAEPGAPEQGEHPVHIGMAQTRYELKGALDAPLAGIEKLEFGAARTDYRHTEFEGRDAATTFTNKADEGRMVFTHAPLGGWRGAIGMQASNRDFAALGEESFVPPTRTRTFGLFATEQREWGRLKLELGVRGDRQSSSTEDGERREFRPWSLSAGLAWRFDAGWHLTANIDRAQRAPAEEELYAHGPHEASATFEIGDPQLGKETANQLEIGLHRHGERLDAKVSAYVNRYDDFIYLADTGEVADNLPVRLWSQHDARFRGLEAEATFHLARNESGHYDLKLWGDRVRATLAGGGNLPRIPAARLGTELSWRSDAWRVSLGATHHFAQDEAAAHETTTPGFTLLNARLAWTFANGERGSWEAFLSGDNLTDRTARLSTSLVKDRVPLPGRNLSLGLRGWF